MKSDRWNISPLPFDNLLPVVFMHVRNIFGATERRQVVSDGDAKRFSPADSPLQPLIQMRIKRASTNRLRSSCFDPEDKDAPVLAKNFATTGVCMRPTRRLYTHAHAACLSPTLNSLIIHPRVNVLNALYSLRSLDQSINPTLAIQGRDLRGSTNERPV